MFLGYKGGCAEKQLLLLAISIADAGEEQLKRICMTYGLWDCDSAALYSTIMLCFIELHPRPPKQMPGSSAVTIKYQD